MSDYSPIEQFLHRISLSTRYMREICFDLDQLFFSGKKLDAINSSHVFVAGLPRSGTTILLEAIHASNEFASLTYSDMPFVMAPNIWGMLNRVSDGSEKRERAHGDGVLVSTESPEAFEEVFWQTFTNEDAKEKFDAYISLILRKYGKSRYLSKNNQNVYRAKVLVKLLPKSKMLVTFREPLQHANSLLSQHIRFSDIQRLDPFVKKYMDWIGHKEFGLGYCPLAQNELLFRGKGSVDHWLEQWLLTYSKLILDVKGLKNIVFVSYESLCSSSSTWTNVSEFIEVDHQSSVVFNRSKDKIVTEFNEELYDKCSELYAQLSNLSV